MFDDAAYHLLHAVFGWTGSSDDAGETGWVDVRHVTEYKNEVTAGDLLEVHAGVIKIGTKSMTVRYEMTNLGSGDTAASMEVVYVLFDLVERKGLALTDELRDKAQLHKIHTADD